MRYGIHPVTVVVGGWCCTSMVQSHKGGLWLVTAAWFQVARDNKQQISETIVEP